MKAIELIKLLQTLDPETEVMVNAWSPQEDYDSTHEVKVCTLGGTKKPRVIVCDENSEYWTRKIKIEL